MSSSHKTTSIFDHELTVKKRPNNKINGKQYWKWYVDIPSKTVKELNLKIGSKVLLTKCLLIEEK